jgi:hypothetical protein
MRAVLVIVANILREQAFQVAFVNSNDVIQEITPAAPYPTLCDSILPRTLERSADWKARERYQPDNRLKSAGGKDPQIHTIRRQLHVGWGSAFYSGCSRSRELHSPRLKTLLASCLAI